MRISQGSIPIPLGRDRRKSRHGSFHTGKIQAKKNLELADDNHFHLSPIVCD